MSCYEFGSNYIYKKKTKTKEIEMEYIESNGRNKQKHVLTLLYMHPAEKKKPALRPRSVHHVVLYYTLSVFSAVFFINWVFALYIYIYYIIYICTCINTRNIKSCQLDISKSSALPMRGRRSRIRHTETPAGCLSPLDLLKRHMGARSPAGWEA